MGVYSDIHKALTQSILDVGLSVPIAHENVDFDPTSLDKFVKVDAIHAGEESMTKTGFSEASFIYQISVFTREGTSVAESLAIVDQLMEYYVNNAKFTSGNQSVVVLNSGRNEGRTDDGWYIIDVSVDFYSDINR